MLPADLALQAKPLAGSAPLAAAQRLAQVAAIGAITAVKGLVEEQLADGRFKVQVEGRSLAMKLPPDTRVGQQIRLVRIPDAPDAYGLAEEAPGDQAVSTSVSSGGRLISALLARPADESRARPAAAAPVFDTVPLPKGEIATKLGQALTTSGLFYEAHQAKWFDGQRPLAALLEEPQGRLSPRLVTPERFPQDRAAPSATSPDGAHAVEPTGITRTANDPPHVAAAGKAGAETGAAPAARDGNGADAAPRSNTAEPQAPAHPATQSIIQQQLATLETGQIVWHGQIWPGQEMEWQIEESPDQHERDSNEADWRTTLSLDLTILGPVEARLHLRAGKVAIRLSTEDSSVQELFQLRGPDLVRALNDAGLGVSTLEVHSNGA